MNYLAHFFLSFESPELLVGQFAGDAVKGRKYLDFPEPVARGILLHRHIDFLTDNHPACSALRASLREHLGLHTPIAMDVYFDHCLAREWSNWHAIPLPDFCQAAYGTLRSHLHLLPPSMQTVLHYMERDNWLAGYASFEGMSSGLRGLSRRVAGGEVLQKAPGIFQDQETAIQNAFAAYFPDLIASCSDKIDNFAAG